MIELSKAELKEMLESFPYLQFISTKHHVFMEPEKLAMAHLRQIRRKNIKTYRWCSDA